jgi:hypothetical protein
MQSVDAAPSPSLCPAGACLPCADAGALLGEPPFVGPGPAALLEGGQGPQQELCGQGARRCVWRACMHAPMLAVLFMRRFLSHQGLTHPDFLSL